ncbi:MAG TPA: transposase [Candidatus Omnitrophota bacterium]|nr:transposase [Candidatus Omnitrophota bacterium]
MVRRTRALKGNTPVIESSGSWKSLTMAGLIMFTPKGSLPRVVFRIQHGSMDSHDFIDLLKDVKVEMKGRKLLLVWDGLLAHRSKTVRGYIQSQKRWLRVERYPAYAPELNPVELLWSPMKTKDLSRATQRIIAPKTDHSEIVQKNTEQYTALEKLFTESRSVKLSEESQ